MKIEIKNINKNFKKQKVLKDVSLDTEEGKIIGILGANGSGKSTLFSILVGIIKGDGQFLYDGVDLLKNTNMRSKIVGFVPQSPPLIGELSAKDNLKLWYDKDTVKNELKDGVLAMLGIEAFYKKQVNKMSGGMKKRLSLACAAAHNPKILFLDEPSAALDVLCKEKISNYLKTFKQNKGTVFLATHDAQELLLCDELYILKEGSLQKYDYDGNIHHLAGSL